MQAGLSVPDGNESARPFLPARDFDTSRAFYEALGFEKRFDGEVAIFGIGGTSLILGRHWQEDWAGNFMMQLMVDDLDAWWGTSRRSTCPSASACRRPRRRRCSPGDCASLMWSIRLACCGTWPNVGRTSRRIGRQARRRSHVGRAFQASRDEFAPGSWQAFGR